jgi:dipeptidyl-peptidase 4
MVEKKWLKNDNQFSHRSSFSHALFLRRLKTMNLHMNLRFSLSRPRLISSAVAAIVLAASLPFSLPFSLLSPAAADRLHAQAASSVPTAPITVEGIYTGKYRDIAALPAVQWTADGNVIIFDSRKPSSSRSYELLNPATGKRQPMFDLAKTKASMKALRGSEDVPFPTFNSTGTLGFMQFDDEIVVLDVKTGECRSVAKGAKDDCTRFSPDGNKLAFVRNGDLFVLDLNAASPAAMRLTSGGSATFLNGTHSWVYWEEVFDRDDRGYAWSPDSRAIAYYQSDESPVTQIGFPHFKPAVPEVIQQRYPKVGGANPKVRIGIVELPAMTASSAPSTSTTTPATTPAATPNTTWIDLAAGSNPEVEYLARMQWLPDGKRLAVETMNRSQYAVVLHFADRTSGKSTKILTETDSGWVNLHDDIHFLADGKHFLWASERTGYNHLYRYTLDGKLVNAVTRGAWAVGEARGAAIMAVDEAKGLVYFKATEKSSVERQLYSIKLDGSGMKRVSEETGSHATVFNDYVAGKPLYYLDTYSTISTPPSLTLRSADGKRLVELAESRAAMAASYNLLYPSLFAIPVTTPATRTTSAQPQSTFAMPAQMLTPRGFNPTDPAKKYPVIVYVYGGPSAPNVINAWQSDNYFYQLLADAGYIVVKLDNRSAAAISKTYENSCAKQLAGDSELGDLLAGVRWLKDQPYVDAARVGVWGWSFGGTFTMLAMTHSQEFKAGIAVAGPTNWAYYDTKYTESFMKTPADNPAGYDKTNLNNHAKNLSGRLYIVHGTYDDNVHPQNTWNFMDELIRANKQFDLMWYPMRKHGISDAPARIHLYTSMLNFWKKNL